MIQVFHNEKWKEFKIDYNAKFRYAISNFGRLISFTDKIENGKLLKGSTIDDYKTLRYRIYKNKTVIYRNLFFHRLVATYFLPNKSDDNIFVLHLDHCNSNNHVSNLKWATKEELKEHTKKNPRVIKAKRKYIDSPMTRVGRKLSATQVMLIKKKLLDPNRKTRLKIIARRFGVTEMTLHRIRTGENWWYIKVG